VCSRQHSARQYSTKQTAHLTEFLTNLSLHSKSFTLRVCKYRHSDRQTKLIPFRPCSTELTAPLPSPRCCPTNQAMRAVPTVLIKWYCTLLSRRTGWTKRHDVEPAGDHTCSCSSGGACKTFWQQHQTRPDPTCCVPRCSLWKAKLKLSPCTPWRRMETADVWLHSFLISTLYGGKWLASRYGRFNTNKISLLLNITLSGAHTKGWTFRRKAKHLAASRHRTPARPVGVLVPAHLKEPTDAAVVSLSFLSNKHTFRVHYIRNT
jgi:hypothetical protein